MANEYVKLDEIKKAIHCSADDLLFAADGRTFIDFEIVKEVVLNIPTADVVEVVRCKDCVHQPNLKTNTKGMMWCRKFRSEVTAIDFCSYGERTPQKEE